MSNTKKRCDACGHMVSRRYTPHVRQKKFSKISEKGRVCIDCRRITKENGVLGYQDRMDGGIDIILNQEGNGLEKYDHAQIAKISEEWGGLVPVPDAARALGYTRQGVHYLIAKGKLRRVVHMGRHLVSIQDLLHHKMTVKIGRPVGS